MKVSAAIAVLSIVGLTSGPALAKSRERVEARTTFTRSSVTQWDSVTIFEPRSFEVLDESGLVSDTLSAGDPGLEHTAADSCADVSFLELFLEHEVSLQYYSTDTGEATDHFFDLAFHVCRAVDDPPLDPNQRILLDERFRAGIDHFIDVLQHHFETRGQSFFSALTQCFDDNGLTYRAPNAAGEVSPDDPSIPYLPIIGYQLLFGKDPVISIELKSDLDSVGAAVAWPMPNDSYPEPGRNYLFINPDRVFGERTIGGVIAHEMAHQMGYEHDDRTDPSTDTSMVYAIGNCVADYAF